MNDVVPDACKRECPRVWVATKTVTARCPSDKLGAPITVTRQASSTLGLAHAEQLAFDAAKSAAIAELQCVFYATRTWGFTCPDYPGQDFVNTVTATSEISQEDADQKAITGAKETAVCPPLVIVASGFTLAFTSPFTDDDVRIRVLHNGVFTTVSNARHLALPSFTTIPKVPIAVTTPLYEGDIVYVDGFDGWGSDWSTATWSVLIYYYTGGIIKNGGSTQFGASKAEHAQYFSINPGTWDATNYYANPTLFHFEDYYPNGSFTI